MKLDKDSLQDMYKGIQEFAVFTGLFISVLAGICVLAYLASIVLGVSP